MDRAEAVTIRAMEPSDAAGVSALIGRPGTFEGTLQLPDMAVASRVEHMQKIEPGTCRLVAEADGEIVGSAGLHLAGLSMRRQHVRMLGIGIAEEWQGKGLGRRLIERLLQWADNWAGILRVELVVHADNDPAIALYRSFGFVEEGRHRAYAIKNGRFIDALCMARLHPNPPALPPAA
ncbi:MAG: GNAT family N-acetyltransferase [Burkholderiales bacterium]|nr:GNAT family N-acetyltransferase [Burkholderiales bacterium]